MVVHFCGISDIGNHRQNNEDAWWAGPLDAAGPSPKTTNPAFALSDASTPVLLIVSDGVGGSNAGEVASQMAVSQIPRELASRHPDWGNPVSAQEALMATLHATHHAIQKKSIDPGFGGMCTTVSLICLVGSNQLWWGQAGDSRIYLFRSGQLQQISRDHSPVGRMRQEGALTEAEARRHPLRNQIDQSLGDPHNAFAPDVACLEVQAEDVCLLCSDGLSDGVWERDIEQALNSVKSAGDVPEVTARLVEAANRASGRDNITVVVALLEDAAEGSSGKTSPVER
jgi:protein phosphatase